MVSLYLVRSAVAKVWRRRKKKRKREETRKKGEEKEKKHSRTYELEKVPATRSTINRDGFNVVIVIVACVEKAKLFRFVSPCFENVRESDIAFGFGKHGAAE